ncbi:MAG: methyltransferase [Rikenellaceae bacterium]
MFKFKEFTIHQDRTAMKVGTDGVLLGAWVNILKEDRKLLDIGTGTGLIALMMAQRAAGARIDAVEIDRDSAEQAAANIAKSSWFKHVELHNISICDFDNNFKYDLIVSNPPFFSDSLLPPQQSRSAARHTVSLTFKDLIDSVVRLLELTGRFALILPPIESNKFEMESKGRLHLSRRCEVKSRECGECKRVMSEYMLKICENIEETELSIREFNSNEYTREYKALTANFYLKF